MRLFALLLMLLVTIAPASAQSVPTILGVEGAESAPPITPADELVRILEDDRARAQLIEMLRQATPAADEGAASASDDLSLARQLADYTRGVAEGASNTIRSFGRAISDLGRAFDGTFNADFGGLRAIALGLLIVALGLFGSYFALRILANRLMTRVLSGSAERGLVARLGRTISAIAIDGGSVVLAWGLGYVLALNSGALPQGQMGLNQTLLLNAFLLVEMSKLALRIVLAPRHPEARFLRVGDGNAVYWSFWAGRVISLVGYTFMFVSPVLAQSVAPEAAAAVQVLVMATAIAICVVVVLQNRDDVRQWLGEVAAHRDNDGLGRVLLAVGQYWHVLVIVYLVALLLVWFANPETALPFMIGATAQSLMAVAIGSIVVSFVSRFVSGGLHVPDDVRQRLPLLETRLHAFVPRVMAVVRWIVIAVVILAIGQAWALFDFMTWLNSEEGLRVAGAVVSATLIVLVAIVLHVVVASWVEYRLNTGIGKTPSAREKTLLNLFKNAFTIALVLFGTMLALAQIGVNIAPLLAGAGVVGLAIGFGAQKLVQDIITGIFIQFENIMNEGDVVAVGDKSGVVEKLTIRSVTIRDLSGTVHLIPFSSVDQVSNMMRGFSFHLIEIGVAYDSDIDEVKAAMCEAFERLMQTEFRDDILDDLEMHGLTGFRDSAVTVRARIKTVPGKQWGAGRRYNEILKMVFAEKGIEIPYPHITYVQGGEARASGRVLRHPGDAEGPTGPIEGE